MPHADASLVPETIAERKEFWAHVQGQLSALLDGQRNWVSNLANASSVIFYALQSFPAFGSQERAVNWCGFYLEESLFPNHKEASEIPILLLGPFVGRPACQFIRGLPGKGVCADAYSSSKTVIVSDVEAYPGHIACDGDTRSELVVPLLHPDGRKLGVLDLDCLVLKGFTEDDKGGLERIAELIVASCDW